MRDDTHQNAMSDEKRGTCTKVVNYWGGTVGLAFMSIFALILLVALLRSEARNRALVARCGGGVGGGDAGD
jgi:hypothetical protein